MNPKPSIFLFTQSFPFKSHQTEFSFLNLEVRHLIKLFPVTILPVNLSGDKYDISEHINVDTSLAEYLINNKFPIYFFTKTIFSSCFLMELLTRPSLFMKPTKIYTLIKYLMKSFRVRKWAESRFMINNSVKHSKSIFYTYWFTFVTTGLTLLSGINKKSGHILISRAHGIDLYEERQGYLPLQKITIKKLHRLILVSKAGYNYLLNKFPEQRNKFIVSTLGTLNHNFVTKYSTDGIFRLVSCSNAIPVKRLDLLFDGLVHLAKENNTPIVWHHIGDGPDLPDLKDKCKRLQGSVRNLSVIFHGSLPNKKVFEYYKNNPLDCFMSTSISEGLPVSMQEAQSFGIPIIATSVGGIPEIVINGKTGFLLDPEPGVEQIADKIKLLINDRELLKKLKINSRINWINNYNSSDNFNAFVNNLSEMLV